MPAPLVSIVIPVFNKWEYTAKCLRAVAENTRDVPHEVIVVDNGSRDETARALPRIEGIRTKHNADNLGFARASNQGAAMAVGRYILFLNNDTEPHAGWAAAMVAEMERDPAVAIVGSKLLYPDGTIQHAGVRFAYAMWQPIMPMHVHARQPAAAAGARRELDAVTAACMLVRPEVFRAVGGFDEGYVNGYEDVDLCLEVRARGGKIVFTPDSVVTHHESVSEGRFDSSAANTERLMARWIDRLDDFDVDFRRTARPLAVPPDRAGASVVVVADRSIWTIAPCLENVWYTTGAQDEIVIVDDSGGAAAGRFVARFAARHPDRVRVIAAPGGRAGEGGAGDVGVGVGVTIGFPRAFRAGLSAATRPFAALLGPNVRVVGDWLGRLAAHTRAVAATGAGAGAAAGDAIGVLTPTLGDAASLTTQELLTPVGRTDPAADRRAADAPPRGLVPTSVAASFTLFGQTDRLRALAEAAPETLFGSDPTAAARVLAARGLTLARAPDVVVYRLNEVVAGADPALRERYLERQGAPTALADDDTGGDGRPSVSVVVVGGGDTSLARRCIEAVRRFTEGPPEIILVENRSAPETADATGPLAALGGDVTVIRNPGNEGFAFAANQGLDRARGRVLAILHDDVVVGPGWMRRARALLAADPAIGAVGPASNECAGAQRMRMVSYAGADDSAAFAELWAAEHQGELTLAPRLAGMCLIVRRELVMRVGGFDTGFGLGKGADDDFSVRAARAGWKLAIALDMFVHHDGGATYHRHGQDPRRTAEAGWRAFCAKWNHPQSATAPADFARLGSAAFDVDRDRVPLRYDHVYCAEAPPLALACRQPVRFLCIADLDTTASAGAGGNADSTGSYGSGWRGVLLRFVRAFRADDPVALIVRIEPPAPGAPERALALAAAALGPAGIAIADAPEVLFDATPLPPGRRGSLFTAAQIFLSGDGPDASPDARAAAACGLTVVEAGTSAEDLRRIVSMRASAHRP
jgi:GT2 family glycosyltransferase